MINKNFTLIILFLFFATQLVWAQVPQTISYQGILTDNEGNSIHDGNYDLTFTLYDSESGGTTLWAESQNLGVTDGIVNAQLGSVMNPLPISFFNAAVWLGIKVGTGSELTPRIRLTSVPYSFYTMNVLDGSITASKIAAGEVVKSLNGLKDNVNLVAGSNVTITPSGNNLTINATGSGGGTISGSGSANYLPLFTSSTVLGNSNIYQTANGNIGIGTTNPQQRLHINGLAQFDLPSGQINLSTPGGYPGIISFATNGNRRDLIFNNSGIRLLTGSSSTAPTKGISIIDNGNVGIGTEFPEAMLHVKGGARFDLSTGQINISTPGGNPGIIAFAPPNGNRRDLIFSNFGIKLFASTSSSATSNGIEIAENGYVGINLSGTPLNNILTIQQNSPTDPIADGWTTYSSKRWKDNIKPIENAIEIVQNLQGVTYDWKENGKHDIGLIAEEVGKVIPEIVAYEVNGIDAKSVDYARIVAVLIEGMKEQQVQLNSQLNTILKLEERISNLENK